MDMYHELNCTDSCIYPPVEEIIKSVKEDMDISPNEIDSKINFDYKTIKDILRGRKNRRGTTIRISFNAWESANNDQKLDPISKLT